MPEPYRIAILPEASNDLTEIFGYITQDSPQNATAMIQQLVDAIDALDRFPHRGRVHRSAKTPAKIVHALTVAPFIVYYRILESDHVVEVLTVRRGTRKPPRKFKRR